MQRIPIQQIEHESGCGWGTPAARAAAKAAAKAATAKAKAKSAASQKRKDSFVSAYSSIYDCAPKNARDHVDVADAVELAFGGDQGGDGEVASDTEHQPPVSVPPSQPLSPRTRSANLMRRLQKASEAHWGASVPSPSSGELHAPETVPGDPSDLEGDLAAILEDDGFIGDCVDGVGNIGSGAEPEEAVAKQ